MAIFYKSWPPDEPHANRVFFFLCPNNISGEELRVIEQTIHTWITCATAVFLY